jgi:hypothetical protein
MREFETKDSGERAQFESGMQRDTEAGKPRFDLMIPLDVPYDEQMITRLAALFGRGAVKYESRNWEQANSEEEMARMKSSGFRHFMQWMAGETDEDHAAAVMFNIIAHETTAYKVAAAERDRAAIAEACREIGIPAHDGSDCEPVIEVAGCDPNVSFLDCPLEVGDGCRRSKHFDSDS